MKLSEMVLISFFGLLPALSAQEEPKDSPPAAQPLINLDIPDDGVRVSVLGYHDFSSSERETAMRIKTDKFRQQMQALHDLDIPVISMADFIGWKNGGKTIPQKCAVITIDDGWKSVYTDAYPILKEFGYPFTVYLYKNYVDGGGKALTTAMITEMMQNGANIGSHSTTHPLPQQVKTARVGGEEKYGKFLDVEMAESKKFLEGKFGGKVLTYAYPGGYFTEEMLRKGEEVGYKHMFTVQPGKVKINMPNGNLPRYVILGNYDRIFEFATSFRDSSVAGAGSAAGLQKELPFPVEPLPGAIINTRLPEISVDLSSAENIDPATLKMHVAGFGEVPANYASEGKLFTWRVNRRLRQAVCKVKVTWSDTGGNPTKSPLEWGFQIDRGAAYLPDQ
ncbi:polysaccharide deacetylase family protein [Luteolibacter sp. AS25]|uniref:polysaccharide deacetylase family protein n=1 Tax=Luteolibacter sp. AS25 TaxID=3135776 RepID=UPI00398B0590